MFHALADPTRRHLLEVLGQEEQTVGQLAEPLSISLPAVSKHLVVLERAGLLDRRREGRSHHLKFNPDALGSASEWLENQRHFWEGSFDKLAAYLDSGNSKKGKE
ncbi:MAG: metalloregulator ArsR/SmtB family transcription factor [Verrucomicrobiota bacterium]